MRVNIRIKASLILMFSAIIMIYFQMYWHYWFVKLLGGYAVNTLLPIIVLFSGFASGNFFWGGRVKKSIFHLLIPLFCYIFFASVSIILNEEGFDNIKRFYIYIYSPVIIFVSILGLYIYKKNKNIKSLFNILFIFGVIFSIYVAITYSIFPLSVAEMHRLETNRGEISGDTGARYAIGDLEAIRYTIPGINSTTYGSLLVPLVFVGLYFRKKSAGKLKYIYTFSLFFLMFCIFMTVSRGSIVSLIVGAAYLMWWRWFKLKEVVFATIFIIISFVSFATLLFLRLLSTFEGLTFLNILDLGDIGQNLIKEEERFMSIGETLSFIYQHPFWGMGLSNLVNMQEFSYGKEHNNYLSLAASFGLLSLVVYVLFLLLLFIMVHGSIKKVFNDQPNRDMGIILCAGLLAMMAYLNFAPAEFHFIWVWFGLSAAWMRNCKTEHLLS